MESSSNSIPEQRALLLEQLASVCERQTQLYQALHDLVEDELAFSRFLLESQKTMDPTFLKLLVSEKVFVFHAHARNILEELQETRLQRWRVLKELRVLRAIADHYMPSKSR